MVQEKKCPNCGKPLQRNYCLHCGYMDNGVFIGKNTTQSISDVEIYLGRRYDKINRNKNAFLVFILGPFYFCYNRFLFFGLFLILVDFLVCSLLCLLFSSIFIRPFLIFILWRIMYVAAGNIIYLELCKIKVNIIKKIHPNDYEVLLRKKSENTTSIIMLALAILIIVTVFLLILELIRNINV